MMVTSACIGLGANLPSAAGQPRQTLAAAIERLGSFIRVLAVSRLYQTEPVGVVDQPFFLNAAAVIETTLAPLDLLDRLHATEREFGRDRARSPAKGPRTLDLDLLLMGDLVLDLPRLTLPHPELARRRFVLAPLAEIAPQWVHPILGKTIAELLSELPDEGANRSAAVSPR